MEWTVKAPILSLEKNYKFLPITNRHHESIIKYCMSKDDDSLMEYLQDMLQELCLDKSIVIKNLPFIDQLFLLIRLRSLCIGTRVEVIVEGEKNTKHKVPLVQSQKSINEHYIEPQQIDCEGVIWSLHYPPSWKSNDFNSYIYGLTIDGKQLSVTDLEPQQLDQLIAEIPRQHQRKLQKAIDRMNDSVEKMIFATLPGGHEDVYLHHDHYVHYIRILYSDTLSNFIELMYVFVKIINMSLSDVMKLTPSDTQVYYQMFVKETIEREKAQNQSKTSDSSRNVPGNL